MFTDILPGQYRALPASIRSAYEPGRFHLGPVSELRVRPAGEPGTDPYKPTPDELFARGKAHFDAGRFAEAGEALEPLFGGYTLRDDIAKDAARMLLLINIKEEQPRKIVTYFEVVKEKAPELILTFNQLLAIGKAYREIKEYERAMIVWRGLIEASYLEDARVGELLRQRGKTLEAIAYLVDLWRSYPNTASIESDFFGLSQVVAQTASRGFHEPRPPPRAGCRGGHPVAVALQSIRMIQVFLARSPKNPVADEASLALVGRLHRTRRLQVRRQALGPIRQALSQEHVSRQLPVHRCAGQFPPRPVRPGGRGRPGDRQCDIQGCRRRRPAQPEQVAGDLHPGSDLRRAPATRQGARILHQVADRFSDAAGAIQAYTRKELKVPEVSIVRPGCTRPAVADRAGRRESERGFRVVDVVGAGRATAEPGPQARNRRRLPQHRPGRRQGIPGRLDATLSYPAQPERDLRHRPGGNHAAGREGRHAGLGRRLRRPVPHDRASAHQGRCVPGDDSRRNLYASGIVLVSPLEIEVLEDPAGGRVRLTVRDARSKEFLPKVQVKVIGSDNPAFISGETDLRGVFVAEGVRGLVTAVARKGDNQYAFYRGTTFVGPASRPHHRGRQRRGTAPGSPARAT